MTTQTIGGALAVREKQDKVIGWLRQQQDDIAMAAATHVKPSAVIRVTQGALRRNDKLAMAAVANPQSLLYALLDCARLGHEPDTDDYYLVPFGNEVTGIEGYKGIIERMYRAQGVSSVVAQVVRQRDRFTARGENTPPHHEYDPFASEADRGALKGVYAYAIMRDGSCSQVITMGRAEVMQHKAKSRGSDKSDSPWQQWEPAMWKKTALRALEPYVPTSTEYRDTPAAAAPISAAVLQPAPPAAQPDHDIVEAELVDDPQPQPEPPHHGGPAATTAQVGKIQGEFKRLTFTDEERDDRLSATARLAGLPGLDSTSSLRKTEAHAVIERLVECPDRGALVALLASGDKPGT